MRYLKLPFVFMALAILAVFSIWELRKDDLTDEGHLKNSGDGYIDPPNDAWSKPISK